MTPFVSVIIPCYNQDKYISETLHSVLNQTYLNWECIIIDDGSTDNSASIIHSLIGKDFRFTYVYKNNEGVSKARNVGLEKARGQFIQFLDADDILDNNKIQYSVNELNKPENKEVHIIISNFKMISSDSQQFFPPFCEIKKEALTFDNFLYNFFSIQLQCGFFYNKLFKNIRFPENLTAQEDWIVWLQIFKANPNYILIDLPLAFYRINPFGRMNTVGADDNQIKVLDCLKEILSYEEFYHYAVNATAKSFSINKLLKNKINSLESSSEYKTGLVLKKTLKRIGILYLFKRRNTLKRE